MNRFLLFLAALLACGLIAAGCGGDDDDDGAADSPATTESAPSVGGSDSGDEAEVEEEPDAGDDTPTPSDATTEQAIEACKQGVQTSAQQLSGELRADLEDICEESATGDEEDVRKASLEICKKIVEESVPAGAAREQGLETCERSVPSP